MKKAFPSIQMPLEQSKLLLPGAYSISAKIYGNERISILCHEFKIKVEIIASQKKDDITMTRRKTLGKNEQTVKRECTNFGRS